MLSAAGLSAYEVSNHARSLAARSRHNLIYWRGGDYLGVGPGAHGRLTADGARWATLTPRGVADYVARVEAKGAGLVERTRLSPREAALERLLMGLRTVEGVAIAELTDLAPSPESIRQMTVAGLFEPVDGQLIVTPRGRPLLDRITLELAAP